ncbi:DciA family protein [Bordetella genomosp. 1]|nr:DciA family protein [Bordetella genomosp. 1]MDQ8033605.1 DciA family protein [Bordetella sp.]
MRGAGVLATARAHLQIQHAIAAVLPPALAAVCVVAKVESQRMMLAVPGPVHAAKLRQLAPRIAQTLSSQGWNLTEISVRIQAGMPRPGQKAPRPPKESQPLGDTALKAFSELHGDLRPGPLADAVARLLRHHGKG